MRKLIAILVLFSTLMISNSTSARPVYLFSEVKGSVTYDCFLLTDSYCYDGEERVTVVWITKDNSIRQRRFFHHYRFYRVQDDIMFKVYYENEHRESGGKVNSSRKTETVFNAMRHFRH